MMLPRLAEHDLFDSGQTGFSGFVIDIDVVSVWYGDEGIQFYDHTDPVNGPRLTVAPTESDSDGIPDAEDNCPSQQSNRKTLYPRKATA